MAHNPLLGNRISLISKKDIRYEGTLYSINEADATVALANVKSYGTEGREKATTPNALFVPPMADIFSFLVFRGCDIKDLHVHETTTTSEEEQDTTTTSPAVAAAKPTYASVTTTTDDTTTTTAAATIQTTTDKKEIQTKPSSPSRSTSTNKQTTALNPTTTTSTSTTTTKKATTSSVAVGTGASLLNRKARGVTTATNALDASQQQQGRMIFLTVWICSFISLCKLIRSKIIFIIFIFWL